MPWHRALWLVAAAGAALAWLTLSPEGGAFSLLAATVAMWAALGLLGMGLLRVVGWYGDAHLVWPASLCVGLAAAVVLCSLPLTFDLGAHAQSMAVVVALMALGLGGALARGGPRVADLGATVLCALVPLVGVAAAAFPLVVHDAWSVAGHDLDTLQHQDGALHAVIALVAMEGARTAPGYPLGVHALLSGTAHLMGINPFQALAVVLLLLPGAAGAGACWLAGALGLSPRGCAAAGVLVSLHPLLLFASMEQYAPQMAAAALVPAAMAASIQETHADRPLARAILPAVMLAGLVSAYHLAISVALPLCLTALLGARPLKDAVQRTVFTLVLAALLAPLGSARLVERLGGDSHAAQSPVKAARRAHSSASVAPVLAPDAEALGDKRDNAAALRWEVTTAHLSGFSPYRDHFLRTSRLISTGLGRGVGAAADVPLWVWANAVVPAGTLLWVLLVAWGVFRRFRAGELRAGLMLGGTAVVALAALWVGAGAGIRAYYGFKLASLVAGPMTVAAVAAADGLKPRLMRVVLWGLLVLRLPAVMAVELEYGRALALDARWTHMVGPVLTGTRGRSVVALDGSPTRRYWNSRLLLARAREVDLADAELVLCELSRCPTDGRALVRSGPYRLLAR